LLQRIRAFEAMVDPIVPLLECGAALFEWNFIVIGKVIDGATERVKYTHVPPALFREDVKGECEIRIRASGDVCCGGGHGVNRSGPSALG